MVSSLQNKAGLVGQGAIGSTSPAVQKSADLLCVRVHKPFTERLLRYYTVRGVHYKHARLDSCNMSAFAMYLAKITVKESKTYSEKE